MNHSISRRALLAAAIAVPLSAFAQSPAWPDRPVRIVVPYPAGGTSDQLARILSARLAITLGQGVIVENRPGATGTLGALEVRKATPDGHTLMLTDNTFAITPALFKKQKFDPVTDFTPITLIATTPVALAVAAKSPYRTVADLVDASRKKPGGLEYGAGGYGGATHLAFELFAEQSGGQFLTIPFKGSGEVLSALLSGTVHALVSGVPSVASQIQQGGLRALAVSGDERVPALPGVPTFKEAGLAHYKVMPWFGILGPRGMPQPLVDRLNAVLQTELAHAEVQQALARLGATPQKLTPAKFGAMIQEEVTVWSGVARRAGIEPQ